MENAELLKQIEIKVEGDATPFHTRMNASILFMHVLSFIIFQEGSLIRAHVFGRRAWTSPIAAIFSHRTGSPVIVATTTRKEGKYFITPIQSSSILKLLQI